MICDFFLLIFVNEKKNIKVKLFKNSLSLSLMDEEIGVIDKKETITTGDFSKSTDEKKK